MSKIDWNTFKERVQNNGNSTSAPNAGNNSQISFFSLKNDKDEAVVRFMHASPEDFEIVTVHPFDVNGRTRSISCIREAQDPIDMCPMCAANVPLRCKFYIHLIEYTQDSQGNIIATPKIWERTSSYANKLANLCTEYGAPLYNNVFKIKRNGAAGSRETSYDIMYANPSVYREDLYPKHPEYFEGYSAVGRACFSYNSTEMQQLLNGQGDDISNTPVSTPRFQSQGYNGQQIRVGEASLNATNSDLRNTSAFESTPSPVRTYTPSYGNPPTGANSNVAGNNYNSAGVITRPVRGNFR